MKFPRIAIVALSALLAGEAALVWSEWMQLQALRKLATLHDDLREQAHREDRRIADLRAAIKAAQKLADKKRQEAAAVVKAPADPGARNDRQRRVAQALLNALDVKEFQAALRTVDRAYNERNAGPFLRSLGLNPEQVNHMLDLMGDLMIAKMDANQAASAGDLSGDSRHALIVETQQEAAAQIQAYLGDQQFAAFQQFNRETGVRSVATNLQTSLSYSSTPLTDAQSQQLVQAMYQAIPNNQNLDTTGVGAMVPMNNGQPAMTTVTKAQLEAAQSILSAPQMAALQAIYNQQHAARGGGF